MKTFQLKVHPSKNQLPRQQQLSWAFAEMAVAKRNLDTNAVEMVGNRIIDNAAVAIAAINRRPVEVAREQALAHPRSNGANIMGLALEKKVDCEWAAWANNVAVRELDMHDTFLAADYSHPADTIPAILAVAQQKQIAGSDVIPAILTAYEVQMNLVKAICLHEYKKDHIAHLAPAIAAGLGRLLQLEVSVIYQAINQAVHLAFSTRQSRKGEISSWKAYAPAFAGKLAIEAVDRAMRGEGAPSPIYEGEDSVLAWMLDGKEKSYQILLPEPDEPYRTILESYTKEHSAEYQAQALIDIAFELHQKNVDFEKIKEVVIYTSHHTDRVIGTGANDPQKFDPDASRETLDHSAMYILAVAWQDGRWHHVDSYTAERAHRSDTVALWNKIRTEEKTEWTESYHHPDPAQKKFGAEVVVVMQDGSTIAEKLDNPNAHPNGKRPFKREQYVGKFKTLTEGLLAEQEQSRFIEQVSHLANLSGDQINQLSPQLAPGCLQVVDAQVSRGIF